MFIIIIYNRFSSMSIIKKIIESIKIFCTCKSSCIVGQDVRITVDNTDNNFKFNISLV